MNIKSFLKIDKRSLLIFSFLLLAVLSAGIASAGYTPPVSNPPEGQPYPPLDVSRFDQVKAGSLMITNGGYSGVKIMPSGEIYFGSQGNLKGGIRFNSSLNQMEYTTSSPSSNSWVPFGSGGGTSGGGGDAFWQRYGNTNDIHYPNGNVVMVNGRFEVRKGSGAIGIVLQNADYLGNSPAIVFSSGITYGPVIGTDTNFPEIGIKDKIFYDKSELSIVPQNPLGLKTAYAIDDYRVVILPSSQMTVDYNQCVSIYFAMENNNGQYVNSREDSFFTARVDSNDTQKMGFYLTPGCNGYGSPSAVLSFPRGSTYTSGLYIKLYQGAGAGATFYVTHPQATQATGRLIARSPQPPPTSGTKVFFMRQEGDSFVIASSSSNRLTNTTNVFKIDGNGEIFTQGNTALFPDGSICGLVYVGIGGPKGTLCRVGNQIYNPDSDQNNCPPGYRRVKINPLYLRFCAKGDLNF